MSTDLIVNIGEQHSRLSVLETKVAINVGNIEALQSKFDWGQKDAAESRTKIYNRLSDLDGKISNKITDLDGKISNKIGDLDGRVNSMALSGQRQVIITLLGFISTLILLIFNLATR